MKKKYESEMLQVVHEDMKEMHELGIISNAPMKEFDEMCFVAEPETVHKTASPARTQHPSHMPA